MAVKFNFKAILVIFLLGIAVYLNSFGVNFIWDDSALVLENPLIRSFANIPRIFFANLSPHQDMFYRPMQNLTYVLDFFLYKLDYIGYHLTNILLHICVAVLFYRLLVIMTGNEDWGLFSALLFLVHPLWVESVTYISGRADILMAIFILLSFLSYIRERILFSLIFYILALFSKEASLIFPLILIFYIVLFRKFKKKTILGLTFFGVVTVLYLVFRSVIIGRPNLICHEYPLYTRMLFFLKAIAGYLGLIFFPINQCMAYTVKLPVSFFKADVLLSFVVVIFLVFLLIYFIKKEKTIAFFLGWFFIMLIPYSGIFPINAFFADHFIYLAAAGVFVTFVYILQKINSRLIFDFVFFGYLAIFSLTTVKYNFVWQDAIAFYERIMKLSANSFSASNNLGVIYLNRGDYQRGEKLIRKALEINPDFLQAWLNLARYYYSQQDYRRAIGLTKGVLDKDPKNYFAWSLLGTFYFKGGDYSAAEDAYKKAAALNPDDIPLWLDIYSYRKSRGNEDDAEKIKEKIGKLDSYSLAELYFREANELLAENKTAEAFISINKAIQINNYNGDYYNLRGVILKRKGDYAAAWHSFRQALKIYPRSAETYNNLGNLFVLRGDFKTAESCLKRAISLDNTFADAYFNLGLLYFQQKRFTQAREYFTKVLSLNASHALAKDYLNRLPK